MFDLRTRVCIAASAFVLATFGVQAQAQSDASSPPYPPPGRLVDVGGWKLHLNCTGEARPEQPIVILEAGLGDFSVEWALIQPDVSSFARVCSYDRAGDGWSEMGPHPRTFQQIVYELHTLLERAGVQPPVVLVGHSYGGWLVRAYQATYPSDVAGIVLVDAGADNPWRLMPDGQRVRSSELARERAIPPVKTADPLRESDIPPPALERMRAGLAEASRTANKPPRDKLPVESQRMRTWALGQLGHVAAAVNPYEAEELAVLRTARAQQEFPLVELPLVVITRGLSEESGPNSKEFAAQHREEHTLMARMSRNGRLVVAERSGHHVQIEEPSVVVTAIRQLVTKRD